MSVCVYAAAEEHRRCVVVWCRTQFLCVSLLLLRYRHIRNRSYVRLPQSPTKHIKFSCSVYGFFFSLWRIRYAYIFSLRVFCIHTLFFSLDNFSGLSHFDVAFFPRSRLKLLFYLSYTITRTHTRVHRRHHRRRFRRRGRCCCGWFLTHMKYEK